MFVLENLGVFKKIPGQLHPVCGNQISYFKTKHFFSNLTRPQAQLFHNIKLKIEPKEL